MVRGLPQELVDEILSHVSTDKHPLTRREGARKHKRDVHTCTLVCRAWNITATSHLFREIGYTFSYNLDEDSRSPTRTHTALRHWNDHSHSSIGDSDDLVPSKTLEQLHAFLDQHDLARNSIHHLKLHGCVVFDGREQDHVVDREILVSLINMLPNLRCLDLVDVAARPSSSVDSPSLPTVTRPLFRATLAYTPAAYRFPMPYTQRDALYLLSCLGAVEQLQIVAPGASHRVNPRLQNVKTELPMLSPRVLVLGPDNCVDDYGSEPEDIVHSFMITHPQTLSQIRKLRIMVREDWLSWWDAHGITGMASNLAAAVGCTLETLELVVNCDHPDLFMDVVEPQMSLARCKALQSIKFTLHVDDQTPRGFGELLRILVPLLRSFRLTASTAPAFSSLSFDVSITDFGSPSGDSLGYVLTEEDSDVLGNNSLDCTLVSFCEHMELGSVRFEYCGRFGTTQSMAEKILCAAFPQMKESRRMELVNYQDEASIE